MKKTALQLLIEEWNKELQKPLGVLQDHRAYHVDDVKRAAREVREIKKRIDQATELLETERENLEEAYKADRDNADSAARQYYKETYG